MKKFLVIMTAIALLVGVNVMQAEAVESSFTITVTIEKLAIELRNEADTAPYGTWAVPGPIALDTPVGMGAGEGVLVKNTSNIAVDLAGWSDDVDIMITGWDPGAAAGDKTYLLRAADFATAQVPPVYVGAVILDNTASPGDVIETGLGAATNRYVYLQLTTPTVTDDDGTQHSITVTLAATATVL